MIETQVSEKITGNKSFSDQISDENMIETQTDQISDENMVETQTSEKITGDKSFSDQISDENMIETQTSEKITGNKPFSEYPVPLSILQKLEAQSIVEPTPIQSETLTHGLNGKDILANAKTGSGKTFAFGIPILSRIETKQATKALIIAPTRELAAQIRSALHVTSPKSVSSILLIGGAPIHKQRIGLRAQPNLIIGTPGRIVDLIKTKHLCTQDINMLVLDETDRMLDMGFKSQIDAITDVLPEKRQTLLFSATLPKNIMKMANALLDAPERISVDGTEAVSETIEQSFVNVDQKGKLKKLNQTIESEEGSIIVFCRTRLGADSLVKQLYEKDFKAMALHGDIRHSKRERIIKQFSQERFQILVATDVAARGIDIDHIKLVVNFNLPDCPSDYIHRIGRTGRNGRSGRALSLVSPSEQAKLRAIQRFLKNGELPDDPHSSNRKPKKWNKPGNFKKDNGNKWDRNPRERGSWSDRREGPRSDRRNDSWSDRKEGSRSDSRNDSWSDRREGPRSDRRNDSWSDRREGPRSDRRNDSWSDRREGPRSDRRNDSWSDRKEGSRSDRRNDSWSDRREGSRSDRRNDSWSDRGGNKKGSWSDRKDNGGSNKRSKHANSHSSSPRENKKRVFKKSDE
ncbi:DEAD/DEAH box helicase [Candidatus Comchoanobacter bicostacola]|uniref:DEAD/DEAH box helicase n=1 Tax=Candidatus Comchoanobacter bicostacola TaxID=2919598 RepID=A0ABY5DMV0_9GAMM|nr:DEAD/DEAH box helicase [Candidatus Comchoanobacter bicostacola]UTC24895.1 DEAD/DEAH box helicase [Candidatus Comchoanobacter bicostacola]